MKFQDRLKERRLEMGMTQVELSNATGITTRTLQYYENDVQEIMRS